jgi:hypothetical protein
MTEDQDQEFIDAISDADVFKEATAPEPKTPTEPPVEETTAVHPKAEATPERERDEKGRFKPKDDGGDESPPAAEAALEVPVEQPKAEKPDHRIPLTELLNEREKRQNAERERQAYEQQLYQLQQQLQQYQQPKEPIDIFADPQAYTQSIEQTMTERMRAMEGNFSLRLAAYKHGDTFTEAFQDVMARPFNDPMRQQVINSPDPGETLVQLYQRERTIKEVGTDPTAYKSRVLEEALKDPEFLAKAMQSARATASAQPTQNKIDLPPSLNKVAAAHTGDLDDASDRGVYSFATRR